jgi:hypothetical protein
MGRRRFSLNEDADPIVVAPEEVAAASGDAASPDDGEMENLGVSQVFSALVQSEWRAVDEYKSAIATLTALGGHEAEIKVLEDVIAEEMTHIGQLEACAYGTAPEVSEIESGRDEAEAQMAGAESPVDESLKESRGPDDGASHYGYSFEGHGHNLSTIYWMNQVDAELESYVDDGGDDELAQKIGGLSDAGREELCRRCAETLMNNDYLWSSIYESITAAIGDADIDECAKLQDPEHSPGVDLLLSESAGSEKGKTKVNISGPSAEKLYHAISDGDADKVCRYALLALGKAQSLLKDDEPAVNDIFGLMSSFADAKGIDDVNRCLSELYDFCDAYGVNIDATEVPADSEVIIDKPDDVAVKVDNA